MCLQVGKHVAVKHASFIHQNYKTNQEMTQNASPKRTPFRDPKNGTALLWLLLLVKGISAPGPKSGSFF